MVAGGAEAMTSLGPTLRPSSGHQNGRVVLRLVLAGTFLGALAGCASVSTTLDRVNQGLAAIADTTNRPTPTARTRTKAAAGALRASVPLTLTDPTATRSDTLTAGEEGTHSYTLYEIDTRGWPEGGVLTVEVDVADGWEGGASIASVDLYPEGVEPTQRGLPEGAVASAWNVAPGQRAQLAHRFTRGQRFLLGAEGSWSSPAGSRNLYVFRARVTPGELPIWTGASAVSEGRDIQAITVWRGPHSYMVLGGEMAVTVSANRGDTWARDLTRWVARAERRESGACAARAGETISGPALEYDGRAVTSSRSSTPAVVVTCALRSGTGRRLAPTYEIAVATADGYSHAVAVSAAQLRELAAALQAGDTR